jgi:RHS repeat-associated protein
MKPLSLSNLFRTAALTVSVVCLTAALSAQTTAPKKETLNIEQAMRAWQERYCALTGADQGSVRSLTNPNNYRPLVWPNNLSGENPGPYPKNCFYAEDLQTPEQAAVLVRAFAQMIKDTLDKVKSTGALGVIRRFDSSWPNYNKTPANFGPTTVTVLAKLFYWRDISSGVYVVRLSTDAAWSPDFDTSAITAANYAAKFETLVNHWIANPVRVRWYSSPATGSARNFGVVLDSAELVDCEECACFTGTCRPGECIASKSYGLDLRFELGTGSKGSQGSLRLRAETPSAALLTPRALINLLDGRIINSATTSVPESYSIYDYNQCDAAGLPLLRQLVLPAGLVDIVGDATGFTMSFYDTANRGTLTGGFYVPGTAYKTVRMEQDGDINHLRMVESGADTTAQTTSYVYADNTWTRSEGVGEDFRSVKKSSGWILGNGTAIGDQRTETSTVLGSGGAVVAKSQDTYRVFAWNIDPATSLPYQWQNQCEELVSSVDDPDGKNLVTTYRYYDDVTSADPNYGRIKQVEHPDGVWERYEYAADGRVTRTYSSFNDSSAPTAAAGAISGDHRLVESTYSVTAPQETITESIMIGGATTVVGRRFKSVDDTSAAYTVFREEVATSSTAVYGDAANLVTIRRAFKGILYFSAYAERIVRPDGTITLYGYAYNSPTTGQTTTTVSEGVPNNTNPLAATGVSDGTVSVTKANAQGQPFEETVTDAASGIELVNTVYADFDAFGRWRLATYNDGNTATRSYNCCGLESETDRTGLRTVFGYDSLHRQNRRTVYPGAATTAHSDTEYVLDAAGRTLKSIAHACGTSIDATLPASITTAENTYNAAGQLTAAVTPRGATISDETITAAGKRQVTTTYADGGTRLELFNRAGELELVSGTAVAPTKYVYGVDAVGSYVQEIRLGEGETPAETEWTKTYRDFAGRVADTVFADGAKIIRTYYAAADTVAGRRGKLASETQPPDSDVTGAVGVRRLFDYNAKGEQSVVAVDLDQDGEIDYAGKDRIAKTVADVASVTHDGTAYNVRRTTTSVWATDDTDTSTAVSVSETSTDGLRSWQTTHGLTTSTLVAYTANAGRTVTTTAPDETVATQSFIGDRLQSLTTTSGATQLSGGSYLFDAYGRLERATDARNGATTYTYYADGAQKAFTTPDPDTTKSGDGYDAQTTQFFYDAMGRLTRTVLPDGAESYASYWPTGALKRTWGARTTPQEMTYDSQGRLKTLATWRDFVDEMSFDSTVSKAVTTWNYSATRGWLENKRYVDGRGPSYEYYPSGSLKRRTWARTVDGAAVTTDYTYTKVGELSGIDYSDSTVDVTDIAFDRLGRRTGITDAAGTLTTTFEGLTPFADDESYSTGSGVLAGLAVARGRDTKLRPSTLEVSEAVSVGYSYRDGSRLDTVSASVGGTTTDHTYTYKTNSALIDQLVQKRSGATVLTTTKVFDKLNRLTSNTAISAVATNAAGYLYNSANQRMRLTEADGRYWAFGYDALGQVTGGTKQLADGTAVLGHAFGYTFDTIGNLKTTVVNNQTATYTPNDLNQYTERTVPAFLNVLGTTADAKAKVAINLAPAQRQGTLFYKQLSTANASVPVWQPIDVLAGEAGAGTGGADAITRRSGHLFVAQNPEGFGYDFDGNLTSDGQWTYSWDAENRLVQMETISAAVAAGVPKQKLEFVYDSAGRRIQKVVNAWNGTAYTVASDTRFLWDGWNLLAELNGLAGNAVVRSYVWGLDLSGTMQGAGGVGGLLAVNTGTATYLPAFDGNGNLSALVDSASGTSVAEYEYGPFGEPLRVTGPAAAANSFRYSTKYTDAETGLVYYGYRYYCPSTGRWLSRDPIGVRGGINLYGFAGNNPVANIDLLGAAWTRQEVLGILCKSCEGRQAVAKMREIAIGSSGYGQKDRAQLFEDREFTRPIGPDFYRTLGGFYEPKEILDQVFIPQDLDPVGAADSIIHETTHQGQWKAWRSTIKQRMLIEANMDASKRLRIPYRGPPLPAEPEPDRIGGEYEAFTASERWRLSQGYPEGIHGARNGSGGINYDMIMDYVNKMYSDQAGEAAKYYIQIKETVRQQSFSEPIDPLLWRCPDEE